MKSNNEPTVSDKVKREPAIIMGVVNAAIALATGFGLGLDTDTISAITAITSIISSLIVRQKVTPVIDSK